jgi:hypothetical protein
MLIGFTNSPASNDSFLLHFCTSPLNILWASPSCDLLLPTHSRLQKTETRYMFIVPKWIKDLNIRPQTLKLVQERVGNTLEVIGIGKDFLNGTPAAQQLRESIDKWDLIY